MTASFVKRGSVAALTRAFFVCTSLTIDAIVMPLPAEASQKDVDAFFKKGYTYCDAKLLADYWGVDVGQAKETGGSKIRDKNERLLKQVLKQARNQSSCGFGDTGHTYEEAELLARYWQYANVGESKDKIAYLYTQGNSKQVRRALKDARRG
jgi:hypothetical protein